jgi:hypothetical protein
MLLSESAEQFAVFAAKGAIRGDTGNSSLRIQQAGCRADA